MADVSPHWWKKVINEKKGGMGEQAVCKKKGHGEPAVCEKGAWGSRLLEWRGSIGSSVILLVWGCTGGTQGAVG